jgi:hypothetical protein
MKNLDNQMKMHNDKMQREDKKIAIEPELCPNFKTIRNNTLEKKSQDDIKVLCNCHIMSH